MYVIQTYLYTTYIYIYTFIYFGSKLYFCIGRCGRDPIFADWTKYHAGVFFSPIGPFSKRGETGEATAQWRKRKAFEIFRLLGLLFPIGILCFSDGMRCRFRSACFSQHNPNVRWTTSFVFLNVNIPHSAFNWDWSLIWRRITDYYYWHNIEGIVNIKSSKNAIFVIGNNNITE